MRSCTISSTQACFPNQDQGRSFDKGLDGLFDLLMEPRTKKAMPQCAPDTIAQCRNIILGQIATKGSADDSIAMLQLIGSLLYSFATEIYDRLQDDSTVLMQFLEAHKSHRGKHLLTVSAPTLSKVLEEYPTQTSTQVLTAQVATITQRLAKQGLKPPNQVLSVDPSDVLYRGKFPNQWMPFAYIGQQTQYKRAFKENIFFTDPLQLVTGCAPVPVKGIKNSTNSLPLWVEQVQSQIMQSTMNHSPIRVILGDRQFYSGIGNAYSYLGLWDPSQSPEQNPRMVVPKKIWKDATAKKWAYLLDQNAPIITLDEIELDYYDQPYLGRDLSRLPCNPLGTRYLVPVASVAVFDNYPNKHLPKSMEWAHTEAQSIQDHLLTLTQALTKVETEYGYLLQKNGRKACGPPSYGKKPRTVFKDPEERDVYNECLRLHHVVSTWVQKKEKLLKRLMYFTISLREHETMEGREAEFSALCQLYHQRWGVEIGVKLVKWEFPVSTNSRRQTRRHLAWTMSALVENSWHFYRLTRAARVLKQNTPTWKPFDPDQPLKRVKWDRKFHPILSARAYIMELLGNALKTTIKKTVSPRR